MSAPRRGSMGFYPRVRARQIRPRINSWPNYFNEQPILLGFPVYKSYTTHAILIDTYDKSPMYGKEVIKACCVLESPPIYVIGLKLYTKSTYYLKSLKTIFSNKIPEKILKYTKHFTNSKSDLNILDELKDKITEIRAIVATQPYLTTIGKKKPEIFEIKIGGKLEKVIEYSKKILGKEIKVNEVLKEGQLVDIIGVTKGKGFQGVVKRFGVKVLPRWHKHRKGARKVGAIGPIKPTLMRFVPRAGQTGFHRRTEYNKLILLINNDTKLINKKGGIKHYGEIRNQYVVILGSTMGPPKRILFLRFPIRPLKYLRSYKVVKVVT